MSVASVRVAVLVSGLLLAGCVTNAPVEEADLFSAGNVRRYEAEQAQRDRRAQELAQDNARLRENLDAKLTLRDDLRRRESTLRAAYDAQVARLDALERDVAAAREQRRLVGADHARVLAEVRAIRAELDRRRAIQDMTAREINQGDETARRTGRTIASLENLSRSSFRDASTCLENIAAGAGC